MNTRRWTAIWHDQQGNQQEYIFATTDNRVIAGIDFRLKLIEQGRPIPEFFTLEEGRPVVRVVPSLRELEGRK